MLAFVCALGAFAQTTTTTTIANTTTAATTLPNATAATTNASANVTTTTIMPFTTTTPVPMTVVTTTGAPVGLGPVDVRTLRNVTCPFSRWQGEPRYCYECRWCPFRSSTCCELEDEIAVLKSVNVSGSVDWDCFITIVHFQQCGRCDPKALTYIMNKTLNYTWDPRGVSIRPCRQACKYIWKQCKDAKTLTGDPVVPPGQGETDFCADYPEVSTPELPCFNAAGALSWFVSALMMIVMASLVAL